MNEPKDASDKPMNSDQIAIPSFEILASGQAKGVRMSFDPKTPDGALKLVKATLKECLKLESKSKEKLHLTDWIIHPAQKSVGTAGEVQEFNRLVVFDVNGDTYECASVGVEKSIAILEMTRGKAPWKPPMPVTVTIRRLGNGNNWMILDPDMQALEDYLKGKR
jgi:hypothetical protein